MRTVNIRRMIIAIILSIVSIPIVMFAVLTLWKIGVFDFGTTLSQLDLTQIIQQFRIPLFPELTFEIIMFGLVIYYGWYKKIKVCGIENIDVFVGFVKKDLLIGYIVLILVLLSVPFFEYFASLFVPVLLIILIPLTVFVISMAFTKQ